jgi:hypothetical protein
LPEGRRTGDPPSAPARDTGQTGRQSKAVNPRPKREGLSALGEGSGEMVAKIEASTSASSAARTVPSCKRRTGLCWP